LISGWQLIAGADLLTAQWGAEQRGEDAEVEQPCNQWQKPDHRQDDPTYSMNDQQTKGNDGGTSNDSGDAASGGSHKFHKGIHFISPFYLI